MKYIDVNTPKEELQNFLNEKGWLTSESIQNIKVPGEGNMNVVLQVITDQRSFILKQSRPFVQKYEQIAAPLERIHTEYEFNQACENSSVINHMPKILAYDPLDYLMMLEFIDGFQDMVRLYEERTILDTEFKDLVRFLNDIHGSDAPTAFPKNKALRELNHQHIFVLPFEVENGFQLDDVQPGLQELSLKYKHDVQLKKIVNEVGNKYLAPGNCLLHGDYYPGSWMRASGDNLYIIDAEFSFVGFKEFDLGVMAAHLVMATLDEKYIDWVIQNSTQSPNISLVKQMAGIEIMRRLIGLAQLPMTRSLEEKNTLLDKAYQLIVGS